VRERGNQQPGRQRSCHGHARSSSRWTPAARPVTRRARHCPRRITFAAEVSPSRTL
jgi:hypothetical protein